MTKEETLELALASMTKVNEQQSRQLEVQSKQLAEMSQRINELMAQIAYFQRQMFGRKSEKHPYLDCQPGLFDGMEETLVSETTPQPESAETVVKEHTRKKKAAPDEEWVKKLPILVTITYEPEEGVDLSRYRKIGEEVTYTAEFKPGKCYRTAHVRPKYGLIDSMEAVEQGKGVLIAPMPKLPIYKGIAGASLLAEIVLQKYEYHMPFYRQIKQFAHLGMTGLKEPTMTGWFRRTMELLRPLYNALIAEIFRYDYCQADETTTPVMNKASHKTDKEYLWMVRAVMEGLVAFFYDEGSRAGQVIKDLTDAHDFKGYLQCDGFTGYTAAYKPGSGVTLINCMVHIRRYFEHALDENRKPASWFIRKIQELYRIEHECDKAGMTYDQRRDERLSRSKPILDEMKQWMENEGIHYSENTLLGKAVTYAYNRWPNMMNYLKDGRILLDNNFAEQEIRPITLGRKNYLFCGNHEAARDMCVVVSLLNTCRNHHVNPRLYLNDVIERMPYWEKATPEEMIDLLPHRWKLRHPEAILPDIRQMAK